MRTRLLIALVGSVALLWVAVRGAGPVPALGAFLDPWRGVWSAARSAELPPKAESRIPGLGGDVTVKYDTRGVPHIFATTTADAYRAMGFVVARDRLFQLELQMRATAGTLSELNPKALPLDREMRRIGLAWSAERQFAALPANSSVRADLQAYADGVNAYIDHMRPSDLPVEYHLLGRQPLRWQPQYTFYLLSRMQWTLSWRSEDLPHLAAQALFGKPAADFLTARNTWIQDPIQPNGLNAARFDSAAVPAPSVPDSALSKKVALMGAALGLRVPGTIGELGGEQSIGSNNWAVAPARAKDKAPLLSGDPHLDLSLPSIWYEVHLVVPKVMDVYGVTFAGTPSVVIGFNRDAAWTYTNTGADVVDFYAESVDVAKAPTKYWLDGAWKPLVSRVEVYRDKAGLALRTDTIYHTHRGPMTSVAGRWVSFRWTAHDTASADASVRAFATTQTATSVDAFQGAMTDYAVPAQNMLTADRSGNIAIRSTGKYPVRPGDGSGLTLFDGTTTKSDWMGYWTPAEYPQSKNPAQGFLSSSNQQPADPKSNPRYNGASWAPPWRAMRINALLRADSAWTPEKFRALQTDPGSARADFFVPRLIASGERTFDMKMKSPALEKGLAMLRGWDRTYSRTSAAATYFELVMTELERRTWDEMRSSDTTSIARYVETPYSTVLAALFTAPTSPWWDDRSTAGVTETKDDIVATSIMAAWDSGAVKYGSPQDPRWQWGESNPMRINHLLRLEPFAATGLKVQSGPQTISPRNPGGTNGSSWRMIVQLSDTVHGWATYPGGQSGNPFSSRYTDRVAKWAAGELDPLYVPVSSATMPADKVRSELLLRGGGTTP